MLTLFFLYLYSKDERTWDDGVAEQYFSQFEVSGFLEKNFQKMWKFATKHITFASKNPEIKNFTIFYPENLETQNNIFPAVVMVNGTNTTASSYLPIFEHLASYGFVVIGNEELQSGGGKNTSETLDFLLQLNQDSNSVFFEKINTEKIGIAWHSQWWAWAINAVSNFENSKKFHSLYTASGIKEELAKDLWKWYNTNKITIPFFAINSTGFQDSLVSSRDNLEKIFKKTQWYTIIATRKWVDHRDVLEYGDAYMTAWFLYTLTSDSEAQKIFEENGEIFHNSDWKNVKAKQ